MQLSGLQDHLIDFSNKVSIISPIVNAKSLKGPTAKMMQELGHEISVKTIAEFYKKYAKRIFVDTSDNDSASHLSSLGYEVFPTNLIMNNTQSKNKLAQEIIKVLESN